MSNKMTFDLLQVVAMVVSVTSVDSQGSRLKLSTRKTQRKNVRRSTAALGVSVMTATKKSGNSTVGNRNV